MELTKEQHDIINSTGNIIINAVAGSGKTTTIIEYAKARPKKSKILYLAFNKSVKLEAAKKFNTLGLDNVKVETAHSLAYKHVVFQNNYNIKAHGYKTHEIAELLGLRSTREKHAEYIVANHINKFVTYFCNSDKLKVQDLNYLDILSDSKAKTFVKTFYKYIEKQTRLLLSKMDKGEIEITHDFYLKKFQISNPILPFDYILFDEGQDASPVMLDIFFKQRATKVIVGDTHQQIYSWRHAVNSLEKAKFKTYRLSTSFRFNRDIANLAGEILKWKTHLYKYEPVLINGKGSSKGFKSRAILARTNLGLLYKAIENVVERKKVNHIYFEGNINSYTYADDGASLYDVLNLYNNIRKRIKDKLIREMKDLNDLEEYIKKTDDLQLSMMVDIVKEYGNDIPEILKTIKRMHVEDDEKEKAEVIFSTVHRCKGMEYDIVQIVNDFITEKKLIKLKTDREEEIDKAKLNEEINLLYVAITRTKNRIHMSDTLIPENFPSSSSVHIMKDQTQEEGKKITKTFNQKNGTYREVKDKTYYVDKIRTVYKEAYRPWTKELDVELSVLYNEGVSIRDLAKHFGRTKGAIRARINRLEFEDPYD